MEKPLRQCERCSETAIRGQRYCKECRKAILREMDETGYLQRGGCGHIGMSRTSEQKENTYETKHGTGHG